MIDPITREEILLAKALGENVPDIVPIIRKEMYLAKIAGADIPTPQAITREEKYLDAIANGTECTLEPITRKEMFYAKSAGQDVQTPTPITRIEMFLSQIAGGGGGGEQPVYHTVKFYNGDVLLGSAQVLHGKSASYTGSEPTMENTDQYYYTFIGWSKTKGGVASDDALTNVTSNRSVYAAFVSTVRSYNVYFYNDYGTELLYETPVEYGSDAMYVGAEPTKESTAQYTYTFAGWSATPGGSADPNILNNITVGGNFYAVFTATVRTYTVRFINGSAVLQTVTVPYGGSATYTGDEPTKEGDWAFKGWSPAPTNVTADMDCYAQFVFAWYYYKNLADRTISGTYTNSLATSIGRRAFSNCPNLTAVVLPAVTSVGQQAFMQCNNLTTVDLPSATNLSNYAFYSCTNLSALILRSGTVCTRATASSLYLSPAYIYVPSSLVDSYKAATNWSASADKIRAIEDYPEICGGDT